jgi:hypothetical protein
MSSNFFLMKKKCYRLKEASFFSGLKIATKNFLIKKYNV